MSDPSISNYDFILFDEAQDANPVMLSVVDKMAGVRKVFVGDTHQAIYGWNGAVDAMSIVNVDHECFLTKSWRFGLEVAGEANRLLNILAKNPPPLQGNAEVPSVKGKVSEEGQYTVIFRTNGALASYAIEKIKEGKKVYVEGGVRELCEDLMALFYLQNEERYSGKSKYKPYRYVGEVLEESQVDMTIKRDLMFLQNYGSSTPEVLELLKDQILTKRSIKKADVILTTAHKSKGLEFDQVVLFDDYKLMSDVEAKKKTGKIEYISREEINLLYVAVTRAKKVLHLSPLYDQAIKELPKKRIL
jgi:DNA helicase IV